MFKYSWHRGAASLVSVGDLVFIAHGGIMVLGGM